MVAERTSSKQAKIAGPKKSKIPDFLIKDTIDGIPFYYAGFRSVLDKTKLKTEIMADSGLQSFIKSYLMTLLAKQLDLSKYHIFVGELGTHLDHRNNLSLDLAVFEQDTLTPDKINSQYIEVAPKIVVEVDVRVELENRDADIFSEFVLQKVRKLHDFGTEKIIWIFTKSKTVIVALPNGKWDVQDWDKDLELLDGITFNVANYLKTRGVLDI